MKMISMMHKDEQLSQLEKMDFLNSKGPDPEELNMMNDIMTNDMGKPKS